MDGPFIYIEGTQVIISKKNIVLISLKIVFTLINRANLDEMLHYVASLFSKVAVYGFLVFKGLITAIITILFSFHQIQDLDKEEETLVKKTESEVKELNFRIRVNGLENERRELLNWSKTDKPPGDQKQRQSVGTNSTNKDIKTDRKSVVGASRTTTTPPSKTEGIQTKGKRPLSDQGARGDLPPPGKSSASEPRSLQKFFKQFKPSKPAWNK